MRKAILAVVGLTVIAAVAVVLVQTGVIEVEAERETPVPTAQTTAMTLPAVRADAGVVADGIVVPAHEATLSLPTGGVVAEVLVQEGQEVTVGQPLLRLNADRQLAAVAQAEAGLARSEAQLAELETGARGEEIAAAQAGVDAAQASVDRLLEGATVEEVAVAQAAVDNARASLQRVLEGAHPQELIAAQAEVENAQAAFTQAQAAYDEVSWREDIGRLPQSLQLQQASNDLAAARARLDQLREGPTPAELAAARAQVRQAEAQLEQVQAPARASDLAAARAELRRAQAQLDQVKAAARPESIAVAQAEVASSRAALAQAQAILAEYELQAPFAGTVAEILPAAGEQVGAGTPLVHLADFRGWRIETDDLTELQVVRVEVGDPARVTFDALPDLELTGVVIQVKPIGITKQGDITYTVVVRPDSHDPRLRWNMTAVVAIDG